jgi:hypothetical protein
MSHRDEAPLSRRLLWFALLWAAGVAAAVLLALAVRGLLPTR